MYVPLILFFTSLAGICIMIGKKLVFLRKEPAVVGENFLIQTPDLKVIKSVFVRKTRAYGYIFLVETIRFSIRFSKILKRKYKDIKNKIDNKFLKRQKNSIMGLPKKQEVSGFLKKISEYKKKIRKIKDQIEEEERGNL